MGTKKVKAGNVKIKVVLADDHHIVRNGIKNLLENSGFISVIGEASNGQEAIDKTRELKPDILISDISMPVKTGLEVTSLINQEGLSTKVILLSMHENEDYFHSAFELGASGYLLKDTEKAELLEAIEKVKSGEKYYGNSVSKIMMDKYINRSLHKKSNAGADSTTNALTKREKEILKLIVEGFSSKEVATQLFLSTRTIDTHRFNIMQKLNVRNAVELVKIAIEMKFV